jgi:hypothetical protein
MNSKEKLYLAKQASIGPYVTGYDRPILAHDPPISGENEADVYDQLVAAGLDEDEIKKTMAPNSRYAIASHGSEGSALVEPFNSLSKEKYKALINEYGKDGYTAAPSMNRDQFKDVLDTYEKNIDAGLDGSGYDDDARSEIKKTRYEYLGAWKKYLDNKRMHAFNVTVN